MQGNRTSFWWMRVSFAAKVEQCARLLPLSLVGRKCSSFDRDLVCLVLILVLIAIILLVVYFIYSVGRLSDCTRFVRHRYPGSSVPILLTVRVSSEICGDCEDCEDCKDCIYRQVGITSNIKY